MLEFEKKYQPRFIALTFVFYRSPPSPPNDNSREVLAGRVPSPTLSLSLPPNTIQMCTFLSTWLKHNFPTLESWQQNQLSGSRSGSRASATCTRKVIDLQCSTDKTCLTTGILTLPFLRTPEHIFLLLPLFICAMEVFHRVQGPTADRIYTEIQFQDCFHLKFDQTYCRRPRMAVKDILQFHFLKTIVTSQTGAFFLPRHCL